jgi:hypothetical protein
MSWSWGELPGAVGTYVQWGVQLDCSQSPCAHSDVNRVFVEQDEATAREVADSTGINGHPVLVVSRTVVLPPWEVAP